MYPAPTAYMAYRTVIVKKTLGYGQSGRYLVMFYVSNFVFSFPIDPLGPTYNKSAFFQITASSTLARPRVDLCS